MRISDWSSDVCSSDLDAAPGRRRHALARARRAAADPPALGPSGRSLPAHRLVVAPGARPAAAGLWTARHAALCRGTHGAVGARAQPAHRAREAAFHGRSEEHTSELQSLMRISYAVFRLKKKKKNQY